MVKGYVGVFLETPQNESAIFMHILDQFSCGQFFFGAQIF